MDGNFADNENCFKKGFRHYKITHTQFFCFDKGRWQALTWNLVYKKYNYLQNGWIKKQSKKKIYILCTCYNPVEKFRKKITELSSTFEETWTLLLFYHVNEQEWNGEVQTASKAETTTVNMTWALFKNLHRKHNTKQVLKTLEWY